MTEHEIVTAYRELRAKAKDPLVDWRDPRQTLIAGHAIQQAEIDRLRLLLIRKSEALAIVASPSMWDRYLVHTKLCFEWLGTDDFWDPMAFAKRESEATDANS